MADPTRIGFKNFDPNPLVHCYFVTCIFQGFTHLHMYPKFKMGYFLDQKSQSIMLNCKKTWKFFVVLSWLKKDHFVINSLPRWSIIKLTLFPLSIRLILFLLLTKQPFSLVLNRFNFKWKFSTKETAINSRASLFLHPHCPWHFATFFLRDSDVYHLTFVLPDSVVDNLAVFFI